MPPVCRQHAIEPKKETKCKKSRKRRRNSNIEAFGSLDGPAWGQRGACQGGRRSEKHSVVVHPAPKLSRIMRAGEPYLQRARKSITPTRAQSAVSPYRSTFRNLAGNIRFGLYHRMMGRGRMGLYFVRGKVVPGLRAVPGLPQGRTL